MRKCYALGGEPSYETPDARGDGTENENSKVTLDGIPMTDIADIIKKPITLVGWATGVVRYRQPRPDGLPGPSA